MYAVNGVEILFIFRLICIDNTLQYFVVITWGGILTPFVTCNVYRFYGEFLTEVYVVEN